MCRLGVSDCVEGTRFRLLSDGGDGIRGSLDDYGLSDLPDWLQPCVVVVVWVVVALLRVLRLVVEEL
jgi:hypothetical protein